MRLSRSFTLFFLAGLAVIGLLHHLGTLLEYYSMFWWYDWIMHSLGGFWLAGSAYLFFGLNKKILSRFSVSIVLVTVFVLGGLWEVAQVADDLPMFVKAVTGSSNNTADAIKDMMMNMFGGTTLLFAVRARDKYRIRKINKWANAKSLEKEGR